MTVRRAFVSVVAAGVLALTGCSGTAPATSSAADQPANSATFPPSGIAVMIGNSATSNTKIANVFDTSSHTLLGRFSAAAPGKNALIGPVVAAPDGRHVYVTAYNTVDSEITHSGVYVVDLTTSTARYYQTLGSGVPRDAVMAGSLLQVIVSDTAPPAQPHAARVVSIDTATDTIEITRNPLPPDAAGGQPVPTSINYDKGRKLTYVTDAGGTVYALFPSSLRYYRKLPSVSALFSPNVGGTLVDERRAVIYQLGAFKSVDERQRETIVGALLSTQITTGETHLATFPYVPLPGAVLDGNGARIYFCSTFTLDNKTFVSRVDVSGGHYVSHPITYGVPEILYSGKLAFSNDGMHLLMPVSTGSEATLAGAMLEVDPASLRLQNAAASPDNFDSGGVIAL